MVGYGGLVVSSKLIKILLYQYLWWVMVGMHSYMYIDIYVRTHAHDKYSD